MKKLVLALVAIALTACGDISYIQKESPNNAFKDYEEKGASVLGVGDPISKRQMQANALLGAKGAYTLEDMMKKVASTYNVAVRWGSGVRKLTNRKVIISDLTFDEARAYIEDVYSVQIVREGERRLLVLTSADEERLEEFSPGVNVSLAQAVRGLADQCGINLVITENKDRLAETTITTSLKNITCMDAFEAILAPHGLSLQDAGDYYTISGLPMRQWTINLMEPQREETQEVAYTASLSQSGGSEQASAGNAVSGGNSFMKITENRDLWSELELDLNTLIERSCSEYEESAGGGIAPNASLLPPPTLLGGAGGGAPTAASSSAGRSAAPGGSFECGYVRINRAVGLVQMRAPASVLRTADEIVNHVQDVAGRRLLVEARVIAVTRTRGYDQAGDVGANLEPDRDSIIPLGYTPIIQALRGNQAGAVNVSLTSAIARLVTGNVATGGGFFGYSDPNIDAVLNFIEKYTTTYSVMNPTVEVMDRQKVTLIDGFNDIYFISQSETIPNSGGDPIVNITKEQHEVFFGVQFSVTAQISDGDEPHTVHIQVPITEQQTTRDLQQNFGGSSQTDHIPIANTRLIDQKVRVRDGEIKVVGGLNRRLAVDAESGVPFLRGIPALGNAFQEKQIRYTDVEFIVLMQVKRLS
ncbi:MAG: hypothetical protein GC134_07270 [Proteobacteria bacterium]|nr:hypothetical protein [Pseudomonadota bacterium]